MLVAQAVRASEIFLDNEYPKGTLDRIFEKIYGDKENIVLVGMPASGKSTVGKLLSEALGRELIDTDDMIIEKAGLPITEIFNRYGEKYFRDLETECVKAASARSSVIIATGGGVPLREENIVALKQNGRIFFLDRPLDMLIPTDSRPLSSDRASLEQRYNERYGIYTECCNVRVDASAKAHIVAEKIIEEINK
jgi:shikimate dehydrogenase